MRHLTWVNFGSLDGCFVQLVWVVQHSYEFEMDTEKQRQRRHDNARLTKSRNARSEQLLVMPTELLSNREWLPGELLSGLERCMQLFKVFGGNCFPFVQHFRYFSKHPTHAYTTECEPGQVTYKPYSTIQNSVCKRLEDCHYISTWILYSQHKMVVLTFQYTSSNSFGSASILCMVLHNSVLDMLLWFL